ncbi:hypothetical protein CIRG_05695 [Coccidioides immitis RMSCC 2394]|uniref:Aminoglycoside phosphotransferase domain-containing protein n=1 Tax=Coccidioides immitis RMSCC 2394 TaxID=404692 RepID=A0A0J6YG51_COCIT|nr:hypothetical protein CIRG_05695 [Coccidioides immitis RMSCC 2394]
MQTLRKLQVPNIRPSRLFLQSYQSPPMGSRLLSFLKKFRPNVSPRENENEEFFRYTTGRWLWQEKEQMLQRYRKFDVNELKVLAARTLGLTNKCIKMSKIGEGNYNKVFRLQMEDGTTVIARIPHPNAGPATYTTASEVATMEFARSVLGIPVPKVLTWCATSENPVGSEYILMEEAKGRQLTEVWGDMELEDKKIIIEDIVALEQKLLSVSFSLLGSLYFAEDSFPGCEAAEVSSDVPIDLKDDVRRRFVIGPTALREFWENERSQLSIDRGPWKSARDYVEAIAHREIAYISQYSSSAATSVPGYLKQSKAQLSPEEHIKLLNRYLAAIYYLIPSDPDLVRPVLWHPDIHDGNIFVHQGKISSVIDWQSTWAGPLILQARTPRLIDYHGEIKLKLPENFKELDKDERSRVRDQVSRSIQVYLYEQKTAKDNPLLNRAIRQPFGKSLGQLVDFAGNSWYDDILRIRECLIKLEKDWPILGSEHPCPYHFSPEELHQHWVDGEGFNETQDFWDQVEGLMDRSGWTTNEDFEEAVDYFWNLRQIGLENLAGDERKEFEQQTRWVLDHRADS